MESSFNLGPPGTIRDLPTPSGYREMTPAILELPPSTAKATLFHRRQVIIGIGIVAALHVGLVLAWWLTPPLRLKAGYSPDRWVQVLSVPKPAVAPIEESKPPAPATRKSRRIKENAAHTLPLPASVPEEN